MKMFDSSSFVSRRNSGSRRHREEARKGDAAISLYKSEIASPMARNDLAIKGLGYTYESVSNIFCVQFTIHNSRFTC